MRSASRLVTPTEAAELEDRGENGCPEERSRLACADRLWARELGHLFEIVELAAATTDDRSSSFSQARVVHVTGRHRAPIERFRWVVDERKANSVDFL